MQQRYTCRPVRIILNRGNLSGNSELVALKIDNTISSLGPTTTMADGNSALVVAASMLFQPDCQGFLWLCLCNLLECRNRHAATPRRRWSILSNRHLSTPSLMLS